MAIVIPESAFSDANITTGEKKALRTLQDGLDDSVFLWYQPKLSKSRRTDIIAYVPDLGIILYEVKDWTVDSIVHANPDVWTVEFKTTIKKVKNPYVQARDYYFNLNGMLQGRESFVDNYGTYQGKVKIPIAVAVIFPNIRKSDFLESHLDKVIEVKRCLFREDIRFIQEADGPKKIRDRLREHFDPWWVNDELSDSELDELRGILYPEITAVQKDKGGTEKEITLDRYQEQVARKIVGSGHTIIRGVAGSGKSLVLCSKALLITTEHPEWKVLITCYNVSLASQLRYYIDSFRKRKNVSLENLEIVHFHSLCGKLINKYGGTFPRFDRAGALSSQQFASLSDDKKETKLDDMESELLGQELHRIGSNKKVEKFQAILVDESQDFHPSWLRSLLLFLDGKTDFLLLSEDPNQKIYPRTFSYKSAGINVAEGRKRSMRLPLGYRSTHEIIIPASRLVVNSNWDEFYKQFVEVEGELLPAESVNRPKGKYPKMVVERNYADICSMIANDISRKVKEGFRRSDFAVLYLVKNSGSAKSRQREFEFEKKTDYVQGIRAALAAQNITYFWLSESQNSKGSFDQFRDAVTISTIFSAKGLEFEIVYIVGLELYPWSKRNKRENASLLYVAMTRAKSELYMYSTEDTPYVKEIRSTVEEKKPSMWSWALRKLGV